MSDKLDQEEEEMAKRKLHHKMMDIIEDWLKEKILKIRMLNINDVRT